MGLGPAFPIVINGGISPGVPFTVGDIALITGNAPPQIGNSIMSQQVDGAVTYVAVSQATIGAGLTETFRTAGGIVSAGTGGVDSVVLGAGAIAAGTTAVSIGNGANDSFFAVPQRSVAIGGSATTGGAGIAIGHATTAKVVSGTDSSVAIGDGATAESQSVAIGATTAGKLTVAIGGAATDTGTGRTVVVGTNIATTHSSAVGIGDSVALTANQTVAIGSSAAAGAVGGVAVGRSASAPFLDSLALGHGAVTTVASQVVIGGNADSATGISSVVIGNGVSSAAPLAVTIQGTNGTGTDIAGANLTLQPGLGTGAGVPGQFVVKVAPALASGTTQQVPVPILSAANGRVYIGDTIANFDATGTSTLYVKTIAKVLAEAGQGNLVVARVNGTFGAPTPVVNGNLLGLISLSGWDGSGILGGSNIRANATENWSATANGSNFTFLTVPNTTTTGIVRLTLEQDGSTALLAATGSYGGGSKVLFLGNAATNPTTNPTGGGILYVSAGALVWRGSSGTVTTLAPA